MVHIMNNESDRKIFEVWAEPRGFMIESYQGSTGEWFFSEDDTQLTFECWTAASDAQRLRADTAEAERDALKDEVGQAKGEYDRAVNKLAAAEQRIPELVELLGVCKCELFMHKNQELHARLDAALNPNPEAESHE